MKPSPTIQDLADSLGVSKSTISRALRNNPRISSEMREKVHETARRVGYKPDAVQARLAAQRWRRKPGDDSGAVLVIAMKVPPHARTRNPGGLEAIRDYAAALGYRTEIVYLPPTSEQDRTFARQWYHRGIPGILAISHAYKEVAWDLPLDQFTVVSISDTRPRHFPVDWVRPDVFGGVELAIQHCRAAGRKRFGLLLFDTGETFLEARRAGAVFSNHAFRAGEVRLRNPVLVLKGEMQDHHHEEFRAWMRRERPDTVIGISIGLADFIRGSGFRVPEDVTFIGLRPHPSVPGRAYVDPNLNEVCRTAVEHLVGQIKLGARGPKSHPRTFLVQPSWVPGASFPEPRQETENVLVKTGA